MTYESWRITFQSAEQAAKSAYADAAHFSRIVADYNNGNTYSTDQVMDFVVTRLPKFFKNVDGQWCMQFSGKDGFCKTIIEKTPAKAVCAAIKQGY